MINNQYCNKHKDTVLKRSKTHSKYCPVCMSTVNVGKGSKKPMQTTRNKFLKRRHCRWTKEGMFIKKTRPGKPKGKRKKKKK